MSRETWASLIAALLSGSALPWLFKSVRRLLIGSDATANDRIGAESRKLNAEAGQIEWATLSDEINRLNEREAARDKRIDELEKLDSERAGREATLKRENCLLRQKIRKLEERIAGLESVFKVGPITPDMQSMLDELDRKTGGDR